MRGVTAATATQIQQSLRQHAANVAASSPRACRNCTVSWVRAQVDCATRRIVTNETVVQQRRVSDSANTLEMLTSPIGCAPPVDVRSRAGIERQENTAAGYVVTEPSRQSVARATGQRRC